MLSHSHLTDPVPGPELFAKDGTVAEYERRIAELERLREKLRDLSEAAQLLPQDDIEMKHCVCHLVQDRADTPTARGFVLQS